MTSKPEHAAFFIQLIAALGGGAGIVALIAFFSGIPKIPSDREISNPSGIINNNQPKIVIINKQDFPSQSNKHNSTERDTSQNSGYESDRLNISNINSSPKLNVEFPLGHFQDDKWSITVSDVKGNLHYRGEELSTGESLHLTDGSVSNVSGDSQRKICTWNNGAYRYQVIWQPQNPNLIRLQVSSPNGEILNRLLEKV